SARVQSQSRSLIMQKLFARCALAAALLGGHVRLGFENNMALPDGSPAPDNAALVAHFRRHTDALHRPLASAADLRAWFAR
ncbi:3-keto-5-aminohexanoate cleavage protein, partial [Ralstonia pseudosolanacearum]|uniref:3-keto-5-aminohexanoate cleavage protein n=1 Tax=Ralstonia pseudosolanacearum TaxID=1310165 RepID=UPI003CF24087